MSTEVLLFGRRDIRGVDSNSLLRMYDQATGAIHKCKSQQERASNDELEKREVTF